MSEMVQHVNSMGGAFVAFAWPVLIWSSVPMVGLLLAELLLRRRLRPAWRYRMLVLALMVLVLPLLVVAFAGLHYGVGVKLMQAGAGPAAEPAETFEQAGPLAASSPGMTWQGGLFLVWLAVVVVMVLWFLRQTVLARTVVGQARESNGLMKDALSYCCRCLGVKRRVRLKISADGTSPVVCGLFRPVILVPHNLAPSLGASHLRAVLLHELAHIKRGDLWLNLAQTLLQIVYFYNPLVWVVNSLIRRIREQAVDDQVQAAVGENARWYSRALANVANLGLQHPGLGLCLPGQAELKNTHIH